MPKRIAIIEDDDFLRTMLVKALLVDDYEVVLDSATPRELIDFLKLESVDAAILDLHLGKGPNGIDLGVAIRSKFPTIGIVFLTSFEDPRLLQANHAQLPAGSVYVVKSQIKDLHVLSQAIEKAITSVTSGQFDVTTAKPTSQLGSLTNSQIELLRLMAMGLSNSEISKRKFITEKSVELSITRLVRALGIERDPTLNQRVHIAKVYFRAMGLNLVEDAN